MREYFKTECKFTPLGFETLLFHSGKTAYMRVNLPRWGLKLMIA